VRTLVWRPNRFRLHIAAAVLSCAPLVAAPGSIKVRVGDATLDMPLEKYVAAVLAGESSSFRSDEATKAMAVAARSFALHFRGRHASEGYDLCSTTHCQRLDPAAVTPRLEALADDTAGEVLWYRGKPIFACYSRDCGGVTEDAAAVWGDLSSPFLRSHPDPYCIRQGSARWEWSAAPEEIAAVLRRYQLKAPAQMSRVTIADRTPSGRARVLALGGAGEMVPVAASSFRFALGRALGWNTVRSDRFEVISSGERLLFRGSGEGHGVGLCQRGADQMGVEGFGYREILAFYYPGATLGLTAAGSIAWNRMSGESVTLASVKPGQDHVVLATAERQVREIARQTGLPLPGPIEIRVYPDVETFRNVTGEPGWVAAHTIGRRIHLQPVAVLRTKGGLESTIRHELLHVFVESQAKPGLPVWFREGLVAYLEGGPHTSAEFTDGDLEQRDDEARARRAYSASAQRVADLVKRNGAATVINWLRVGMPK
jgi:stage II sporulation protein D